MQWHSYRLGYTALCPEARNILASPVNKTTEFEVENWCKNAEEAKAEYLL